MTILNRIVEVLKTNWDASLADVRAAIPDSTATDASLRVSMSNARRRIREAASPEGEKPVQRMVTVRSAKTVTAPAAKLEGTGANELALAKGLVQAAGGFEEAVLAVRAVQSLQLQG